MNAVAHPDTPATSTVRKIDSACDRIAPTWPLDQFIAVNPYWGWRSMPAAEAAGVLGALTGTTLTMPRSWYREQWAAGRFTNDHLEAAAAAVGSATSADDARAVLLGREHPEPVRSRMALVTDVCDVGDGPRPGQTWTDHVTHEISQHCGAYFDEWQASWHQDGSVDLFAQWRFQQSVLRGVAWQRGRSWARGQLATLPAEPTRAIEAMLRDLNIPEAGYEAYLTALLGSVNGWAAWCSYRRWQARLGGGDDREMVGLLAIRLAWEWMLHRDSDLEGPSLWDEWAKSWLGAERLAASIAAEQRVDWVLQNAVERSYQDPIISALKESDSNTQEISAVQAVFCIDVRSEVIRRALESVTPEIHTRGFAGFFGLPISYTPVASSLTRPQLPGLLAPAMNVTETTPNLSDVNAMVDRRSRKLDVGQRWSRFRSTPASVFSFVESMGLFYGPKLVKDSLPDRAGAPKWEHEGLSAKSRDGLRPQLGMVSDDPAAAAAVANGVLRAMGLSDGFAPLVLVCGHGSQSANNPQAAGLECGACGGQTGEVNARVLADLLNSTAVRGHLTPLGIEIPPGTWFIAGLHNTTTDEVQLFDTELAPDSHQTPIVELQGWLAEAGKHTRTERASSLGLGHLKQQPELLRRTVLERANDWSQVRPEWGLAGNASFVVAPRWRTRHMNLAGRSFLHDYDWRADPDLATLTLIMTAPMIVANWINMQYHASTVDNRRYGSGNKVLHNVVGGRLGVFEGNGGDLRIGLAMQSLHDGQALRHIPLRLSVFIEAPRNGIDAVISQHDVVGDLVSNGWILLFRIEPTTGVVEQWTPEGWFAREPHVTICEQPR